MMFMMVWAKAFTTFSIPESPHGSEKAYGLFKILIAWRLVCKLPKHIEP